MRVVGICRFSYPALGGFKRMHDSVEEREVYLYAPERMELRFRHFEALTLPSIAAQTDPRFTFLIVTGENMPKPYWERLHDITAPVEQIRIVTKPPMKHRTAMQVAIQEALGENDTESMQFRLDDDDAVGTNFVRSLYRTARLSGRLRQGWENMVIEFSTGFSVHLTPDGILAQKVQGRFLACGLAVTFRPGAKRTIMNYAHHKLFQAMPTIIEPVTPMYLRAVHDDNDSKALKGAGNLMPLTHRQKTVFRERFNVTDARVIELFGGQQASLDTA